MNKRFFGWASVIVGILIIVFITGCEQEDKFVGANVVGDNAAQFERAYVDVVAKTLLPDTLRADRNMLQNATIGVYDESIFGKTKSYFYSQVRLGTLNPEFGENPVVDSVILSIPVFGITSDTISYERNLVKTTYSLSNVEGEECTITDTITQYQNKYLFEIDSLYGNRSSTMTMQVHRIMSSLNSIDSARYSNQTAEIGELFGSMNLSSQVYKNSTYQFSGSERDSTSIAVDASPTIKMHLEGMKSFIQNQIVDQQGSTNLGDQVSFINNVLKGIRIGVEEENGFIFNFDPTNISLTAYISIDNEQFIDANNDGIADDEEDCPVTSTTPRTTQALSLVIGSSIDATNAGIKYYNVTQNHIINENGSIVYNQGNLATNYLEGMGGAKTRISLDASQIEAIRDSVRNNNWVISEARFKIYPDTETQGILPLPDYLYAYNYSTGEVLPEYIDCNTTVENPQGFPYIQISRPYGDNDNEYYLLRVTEYIKNIVENNAEIDDIAIEIGNYLGYSKTCYFFKPLNAYYSNRVFNPYRLAIVGTNGSVEKKLQLEIFYNKKEN